MKFGNSLQTRRDLAREAFRLESAKRFDRPNRLLIGRCSPTAVRRYSKDSLIG